MGVSIQLKPKAERLSNELLPRDLLWRSGGGGEVPWAENKCASLYALTSSRGFLSTASVTMAPEKEPTIAARSRKCLRELESCVGNSSLTEGARQLAQDQLKRFNTWIDGIGVLAYGHASLDYRLHEAPRLSGALVGMLEVLQVQIEHGTSFWAGLADISDNEA